MTNKTTQEAPLNSQWCIYYDSGTQGGVTQESFEKLMKELGSFDTVEGFWRFWNHINFDAMTDSSNIRIFRKGINPDWNDPHNCQGGKWVVHSNKRYRRKVWTDAVMALIGEQFSYQLSGLVLSSRRKGDSIKYWTQRCMNPEQQENRRCQFIHLLRIPPHTHISFQPHSGAISWNQHLLASQQPSNRPSLQPPSHHSNLSDSTISTSTSTSTSTSSATTKVSTSTTNTEPTMKLVDENDSTSHSHSYNYNGVQRILQVFILLLIALFAVAYIYVDGHFGIGASLSRAQ
eukprot:gb/GECH01012353.1/.p1 GENE.gb/GECH01012353.1/~~gb/GECH01012353.1/.p1  ORF type:complete len:289 (+),score=42.97 gb/GECH01012353.1/:1-867(+)